jgi:putative transposase
MPRTARLVIPNCPHHVIQRGNRRQQTFFKDEDYLHYIELMAESCQQYNVEIWAYCLMPNHIHLIAVPADEIGFSRAFGEAHKEYARYINRQKGWTGHLWQSRFSSFAMDETYLLSCARYVERNPVKAKLCHKAEDWIWSSARAHITRQSDELCSVEPLLKFINKWEIFLMEPDQKHLEIQNNIKSPFPLASEQFLDELEEKYQRSFRKKKAGRKPKKLCK